MRRALVAIGILLIGIAGATAWVAFPVVGHIQAAEDIIDDAVSSLGGARLEAARSELEAALDRLNSVPAKMLGFVPLVATNLGAVESVTEASIPVVDTAADLARASRNLRKDGFIRRGRIRVPEVRDLQGPLSEEVIALRRLEIVARDARTGAIVPPLWDELTEVSDRATELRRSLEHATTLVRRSPKLVGVGNTRRYLVMLMNNAELRGAGGILAGIGTMRFGDGRLELEDMHSVHDFDVDPRIRVAASPTYERRFAQFDANTTLWLNTTYSPDVPEVAIVASRLFERVTRVKTDGALILDPRGLEALLDEDAVLQVDKLGEVEADDLPEVVYSDAYEAFDDQVTRRETILELGVAAFENFLSEGLPENGPEAIAEAVAGGHLSFVSFDPNENRALTGVGVSHDLPRIEGDTLMVTVQNYGGGRGEGSKLDYWASRTTEHACEIEEGAATCATSVRLRNRAPKGLTTYVAGRPYGLLRSYVEIYVPGDAALEEVRVDGRAAEFRPDPHDDMLSLGVYLEIPRTDAAEVTAIYRLPLREDGYRLVATPQPLAHDAQLSIALGIPEGWTASGTGETRDDVFRFTGDFDSPIEIEVSPADREGLSTLWQKISRFWNEPLF